MSVDIFMGARHVCLGKGVRNDDGQETGQWGLLVGAGSTSSPHGQKGCGQASWPCEKELKSSLQGRDPEEGALRMWLPKSS